MPPDAATPGRLRIRPADPRADRERIGAVLARSLAAAAPTDRLDWLYLGNPWGPALVWLAEAEETGEAVATSAAHRRRFRVGGREVDVLNLSDFAIDARYRTLGPALSLLRATLGGVAAGGFAFSYDIPSATMAALYRRMGSAELARMDRLVYPLSLRPVLERRAGRLGRAAAMLVDPLLRMRDRRGRPARALGVKRLDGPFGEEFDEFESGEAGRHPVRGVRSAAYLEWRYARHRMWRHETLCARRGGGLAGFLVWRETRAGVYSIAELEGGHDLAVARALVTSLASIGRARGATSLGTEVLAGSPAAELFRRLGFVRRGDGTGPFLYPPEGAALPPELLSPGAWWFLEGDRDI